MLKKARLLTRPTPAVNSPARPPARRDVPLARARAFQFSHFSLEENGQTVLHCAHTAIVIHLNDPSKLASCSQGWGLIDLPLRASNEGLRRPRVARAQKIISLPSPPLFRKHRTNVGGLPILFIVRVLRARRIVWLVSFHSSEPARCASTKDHQSSSPSSWHFREHGGPTGPSLLPAGELFQHPAK